MQVLYSAKNAVIWGVTVYSLVDRYQCFGGTYFLYLHSKRGSSCERWIPVNQNLRHYIPEDYNVHIHPSENLKSHIKYSLTYCITSKAFPLQLTKTSFLVYSLAL
jgi:hypothetical protein